MATATVIAPMIDTLLSIRGASTANQVHNIEFSGIDFLFANYLRPSNSGFLDGQAGQYNVAANAANQQYVAGQPLACMWRAPTISGSNGIFSLIWARPVSTSIMERTMI